MILGMPARRLAVPVPGLAWDPLKARTSPNLLYSDSDTRVTRVVAGADGYNSILGTTGKTSGRWAFEVIPETLDRDTYVIGVASDDILTGASNIFNSDVFVGQNITFTRESIGYLGFGSTVRWSGNVASNQTGHSGFSTGDVITVDVDFTSGNIRFYQNGTLRYTRSTAAVFSTFGTGAVWYPAVSMTQIFGGGTAFIRGTGLAHLPSGSTEWDDI